MSGSAPSAHVATILAQTRARLLVQARIQTLGPYALAAAVLAQIAFLPGAPAVLCGALAALSLVVGVVQGARLEAPKLTFVGAYLDARLGRGAALATAAEVFEGAHERFSDSILVEASGRLSESGERAYVQWRLSPASVLTLAALALAPLSLSQAPAPVAPELSGRSLLDPSLLGASGGGAGPAEPGGPEPLGARYGATEGGGSEEPEAEGAMELPLDVAAALARAAGAGGAGASGASGGSGEEGGEPPAAVDPILSGAGEGQVEAALRELAELRSTAEAGQRAAQVRLAALREALSRARGGGGASSGGALEPSLLPSAAGSPGASPASAGAARLPRTLAGALENYFGS